ncbi:MAG: DNA alkylation repair protein [Thermoplasmatota archaeon]
MVMEDEKIVEWTIEELRKVVDQERLEWSKGYYPSSFEILGVKVPDLRNVRKELGRKLKGRPPSDIVRISKKLVDTEIFECQQVAYELLDSNKKALLSLTASDLEDLRKGLDNWVSVDTYSGWLAGVAWRDGRLTDDVIEKWARSDNRWERRTAVVCTIALNQKARGGTGDVDRTLWVCGMVAADRDDMVEKALSWALRELSKMEKEPVIKFMEKHDSVLPKRVKREVSTKLRTGKKNG